MKNRVVILAFLPVVLAGCAKPAPAGDFVYRKLKKKEIGTVDAALVTRTALPALRDLESQFAENEGNVVVSPASYLLAVAGLSSVSDAFPNESFGLSDDSRADLNALLSNWNFEYSKKTEYEQQFCAFQSAIVHQQVGETYRFDDAKREDVVKDYISTIVSKRDSYHADAEKFFHEELEFTIPVPDPKLNVDGVITYGAFKMKDYVPGGLGSTDKPFRGKNVPSYSFGSIYHPKTLSYYRGTNYEAFQIGIQWTSLVIVLPSETVSIDEVRLTDAFEAFNANKAQVDAVGYLPYFHIRSEEIELTESVAAKLTGREVFYSRLLADDVENDLVLAKALQTSDFEFNQYGVAGESITALALCGESIPEEHEVIHLEVNRPFYAISIKDWFPLFVNKVVSL